MPKSDWATYLTPDSIVFEIGAYEGAWVKEIASLCAEVYAFEPSPTTIARTRVALKDIPNVHLYNFGLGSHGATLPLGNDNTDGASFTSRAGKVASAQMVDIDEFVKEHSITSIDVARVNIEGGEFDLIPRMFACGVMDIIIYFMVHWHYTVPDVPRMRVEIDNLLLKDRVFVKDMAHPVWNIWKKNDGL